MKYLIGMDGGGTKTDCLVTDIEGNIILNCTGGPVNIMIMEMSKVFETLFSLLNQCKEKSTTEFINFQSVVLGTAGAGRKSDAERLEKGFKEFLKLKGIHLNFFVESDARIALEGAFSGKDGCILISGTGSIMFGKDLNGRIHRVGGFGRMIGDEGSGYIIGRKGLNSVAKYFDGRGDHTILTKLLAEKFGIDSAEKLINGIYRHNPDVASVAPLVIEAAERGDLVCSSIAEEECEELISHILAMGKKLNVQELKLALIGGIIASNNFFSKLLRNKIESLAYKVKLQEPEFPPAMGAVLIAKEKIKEPA
jgi:N-acetylglucosamine kinase-like BadF-type ATPase